MVNRWLWRLVAAVVLLAAAAAGAVVWWLGRPLALAGARVEVSIEPGTPPRDVARLWVAAGVQTSPEWLYQWFRWSGDARRIRAGSYEIEAGTTPRALLDKMVRGDETLETVRLIEGWTFRQVRQALATAPHLKPTITALSDAQVAAAIGLPVPSVEGRLFPDTYAYSRGVSDVTVLRRAMHAMQRRLDAAWATRADGLPLATPDEALVLASIVEKETGTPADRGRIAGVFTNRLRIGMPLQSDPTVIYGLGTAFDGNLRRADLVADTPWNTYTRAGLPPTPIAMPGLASLQAVMQPEATRALYFVARGDGSGGSVFSENLADHNRAVNEHQKGPRR
ncbi:endolytic transglycosylase MltG [Ideonella sp.]|uniref:endolytic transglycosylase MltG n=1 Tax=Ideonella sp. TaxID=1929293 RepID=UPI0035B326FD